MSFRARWKVSAAVVVALLPVLAGCGSGGGGSSANKQLTIAVVPKAVGFDYWTHVKDGAEHGRDPQKSRTFMAAERGSQSES